jgi:hypothetical protein
MSRDRTRTRDRPANTTDDADTEFDPGSDAEFDPGSDAEFDPGADGTRDREVGSEGTGNGLRGRAAGRALGIFSPRTFLAALFVTVGGLFAASTFVPLPGAGLLGVFAATFLFGLAVSDRRYAETALAGAIATAGGTFLDVAVVAVLGGAGVPLVAAAGVLGAAVAAVGTYFGRDLRDGLTRDI